MTGGHVNSDLGKPVAQAKVMFVLLMDHTSSVYYFILSNARQFLEGNCGIMPLSGLTKQSTQVKILQLVNKLCSQQACNKLVNKS